MEFERTPDERFDRIGWNVEPHYLVHPDGLRQHYVDERPVGEPRGTFLLMHGEPTWAYLYRDVIRPLVELGYRVVAPDHFGFGRSDKPVDEEWFTIARHRAALEHLIAELDLRDITLVVQDWGGPIGLITATRDIDRFDRIFILNTWLHTKDFKYSDGIRIWRQSALDPSALGGDMPTGTIVGSTLRRSHDDVEQIIAAFDAPFTGEVTKAGARRFPFCLPFGEPVLGDADEQEQARVALRSVDIPVHVVFGDDDPVFPWEWAEQWADEIPGATLDRIEGAGHFLQIDAGADLVAVITRHLVD
ncbi:MAG: alpha/beta fold hydrolase [Acidobacteria bacterium]|nr:alpha/beta fold hydrolase [Acidobacteriota bacterium]